jgi:hypothetical protein
MLFDAIFMYKLCQFSPLKVTLRMMSNNRRSVSSISFVHVRLILKQVCYSPDEEIDHDVICWMIAAFFFEFSAIGMYSPLASSIGK